MGSIPLIRFPTASLSKLNFLAGLFLSFSSMNCKLILNYVYQSYCSTCRSRHLYVWVSSFISDTAGTFRQTIPFFAPRLAFNIFFQAVLIASVSNLRQCYGFWVSVWKICSSYAPTYFDAIFARFNLIIEIKLPFPLFHPA